MTVSDVVVRLSQDPEYCEQTAHIEKIPARDAKYGTLPKPLPLPLEAFLTGRGLSLYTHQCDTIESIRDGKDLILTTATASGKTLAFTLPIIERLVHDPAATALYLYPNKALSQDQLKTLLDIEKNTGITLNPAIYDGDTPAGRRPRIRSGSRIVISNPYELHTILPLHHLWSGFFKNLAAVVIDEAHQYRGVFGSNMAFVIRRLRRICARYGNDPLIVLSSATIANPEEFAGRLTGKSVTCISTDGSPRGTKHFVLYNPFPGGDMLKSTYRESGKVLRMCMKADLRILCFTGSRKLTELITLRVRDDLIRKDNADPALVSAYRAGYLPEERREIEDRMKRGLLRGIISTNALEVGIDVGCLDGVIMTGFPGTIMSTWQQAGRAGRTTSESLAILVANPDPLDQYFMNHPEQFFQSCHEHAIIDLDNPYILSGQVLCAAAELPVIPGTDNRFFGNDLGEVLSSLSGEHLLSETRRGYIYSGSRRPVELASLGALSEITFRVICNGETLETMDQAQAFREAHEGAILYHQGEKYLVQVMDFSHHVIRVERTDVDYYTKPLRSVDVRIVREEKSRLVGNSRLSFGEVTVTEHCSSYRVMRYDTIISVEPLSLPPVTFNTRALWFVASPEVYSAVENNGLDFAGGLHGAEHALIAVMPFHVMCDRRDIGGFSSQAFPGSGDPIVLIYDGFPGGIGLAENAFSKFEQIVKMTTDLVHDCKCEEGCPSCIYSPKCGNDNQPLDKDATVLLLGSLGEFVSVEHEHVPAVNVVAFQGS
jgi:DEAD/DEAH box helicase domain-containing protein